VHRVLERAAGGGAAIRVGTIARRCSVVFGYGTVQADGARTTALQTAPATPMSCRVDGEAGIKSHEDAAVSGCGWHTRPGRDAPGRGAALRSQRPR
jgi:hypothetical protein